MQGSWYKYFLISLRYYYRLKGFFLFFFKLIIVLKIISIFSDIYFGYFPNIFKDSIFRFYFFELYNLIYINYFYWFNIFWLILFFFFLCFWFFFRSSLIDRLEVSKREKLKEQKLKDNEVNLEKKFYVINIKQKNYILKKNLKKLEKLIKKYL